LELELLSGSLKDLLGLVRALPLGPELYWSTTSKSAIGYRLADGAPPVAVKARPIRLPANIGTRAALRRIVWGSIGQFLANVDALMNFRLPEGLHQMRVALRRLRVALRLAHEMLDDADAPVLDAEWGAAIGVMGTARDLDVILTRIGKGPDTETGDDVRRALTEERAQAYASVVRLIQSASFQHLLVGTVHWAEHLGGPKPDDLPLDQAARALLKNWRRKLRRKSGHLADLSPEARHRIRIGLKRLRYATEFFTSLSREPARETLDRLRLDRLAEAQEHLGDLNDLDVGASLGAGLKGDPLPRAAILEALEAAARDQHRNVPKLLEKAQDAVDLALAKRKSIRVRVSGKQR
jgi:CHAD domain-containing protein